MTDPMLSGEGKGGTRGKWRPNDSRQPPKKKFPSSYPLRARWQPKRSSLRSSIAAPPDVAPRDAARTSLLVSSIGLGGWSCNLAWVASDACYEVAAFLGKKKTARFKFTPLSVKRVSPKLVFLARAPLGLSSTHHPFASGTPQNLHRTTSDQSWTKRERSRSPTTRNQLSLRLLRAIR